ncbi:glycerol-3-phosphate acyltransferase PlsY [Nicoletella semolina]|uniref:Glycerol-3-phosphate acyltransferase n=1 Tax=Nicoletella semolina TaxID=271160 RepID=A0A4R2N920_9PAST|nr:glycerol-3-phosphate 1-O-acyltransferase PlsY [Nicoletella semolina]MDH2924479.1 glycerol-3-phosphate acyltransferase [Nicoletella semolina]TCP17395.1 glycerol-3-phosphate acyltransferase PlsY [Nicoletella semolina]
MSMIAYLFVIGAYLLGSISSAVIFCRLAGLPDPRQHGSHNPGATNVFRLGGKLEALGVLFADILKGMLPVSLGFYLALSPTQIGLIGLSACLGHIFPLFFSFKGGKGVATALGVIIPMGHIISGLTAATWLLIFLLSGYSSLSAIITALVAPLYVWWCKPELTLPVVLVCCLLIYRHHENLQRLWRGQEDKVWKKFK